MSLQFPKSFEFDGHVDVRGTWQRVFDNTLFSANGIDAQVAQVSVSTNPARGTLRGLHSLDISLQEFKAVVCVSGRVQDVAVGVDRSSPEFSSVRCWDLTPGKGVLIPPGYARAPDNPCLCYARALRCQARGKLPVVRPVLFHSLGRRPTTNLGEGSRTQVHRDLTTVLLTGPRGFLAREISNRFLAAGFRVVGIDVRGGDSQGQVITQDAFETEDALIVALDLLDVDPREAVLIHTATHFTRTRTAMDESLCEDRNRRLPLQYATRLKGLGLSRMVNFRSSCELAGNTEQLGPYAKSKKTFWQELSLLESQDFQVTNLVIEESMGPGDSRDKLFPSMLRAMKNGEIFEVQNASQEMNFAHSAHLADFLLSRLRDGGLELRSFGFVTWSRVTPQLIWDSIHRAAARRPRKLIQSQPSKPSRVNLLEVNLPLLGLNEKDWESEVGTLVSNYLQNED